MKTCGIDTAHKNLGISVGSYEGRNASVVLTETFRPDGPEKAWDKFKRESKKNGIPILESVIQDDWRCVTRLRQVLAQHPDITHVCIEAPTFSKRSSAMFNIGAIHGTLVQALVDHNIPFLYLPPNKIKMALTGMGNAEKEDILAVAQKLFGISTELDSNQSDSLAMSWLAWFWSLIRSTGAEAAFDQVPVCINKDWLVDAFFAEKPLNKRTKKKPGVIWRKDEFFWLPESTTE